MRKREKGERGKRVRLQEAWLDSSPSYFPFSPFSPFPNYTVGATIRGKQTSFEQKVSKETKKSMRRPVSFA
jgi:hypothetical protein